MALELVKGAGAHYCANSLPCFNRDTESLEESPLEGRVCQTWKMLPGILALAAIIAATFYTLVQNNAYFCLVYVPGGIGATYLIYLGIEFDNLQSFEESNHQFRESLQTLEEENSRLTSQVEKFEKENKLLEKSAKELEEVAEELRSEKGNLERANEKLKETVEGLEELKKTLGEKAGSHVESLQGLSESLKGVSKAAKENHETFGPQLESFVEEVTKLQKEREKFSETGSEVEKKMELQLEALLKTAEMLQQIFTKVNDWKDDKHVEERLRTQEELNQKVLSLTKQNTILEVSLEHNQKQLEESKRQLEELKKVKEGFGVALKTLLEHIEEVRKVKSELASQVELAAKKFEDFKLTGSQKEF